MTFKHILLYYFINRRNREVKMKTLYIGSTEPYAGKGWVTLALGLKLKEKGLKLGYFRPVGTIPIKVKDFTTDEDAVYLNRTLNLGLDEKLLSPVLLTGELITNAMSGKTPLQNLTQTIKDAFQKISQNKDLVLVGGAGAFLITGSALGLSGLRVAQMLEAKILLLTRYTPNIIDEISTVAERLNTSLIGLIINAIPQEKLNYVRNMTVPYLSGKKINVLGTVPYDRILGSLTVGEVTENLNSEIITGENKTSDLIEHFLVGAMTVESAMKYFQMTTDKAVITGGDRSDIQLAALDTPTTCLILTGNLKPSQEVLNKAKGKSVPIILVKADTLTTVEKVDQLVGKLPVRAEKKVSQANKLFDQYVDFSRICSALGV